MVCPYKRQSKWDCVDALFISIPFLQRNMNDYTWQYRKLKIRKKRPLIFLLGPMKKNPEIHTGYRHGTDTKVKSKRIMSTEA